MTIQFATALALLALAILTGIMALCAGRDHPMALPASLTAVSGVLSALLVAAQ